MTLAMWLWSLLFCRINLRPIRCLPDGTAWWIRLWLYFRAVILTKSPTACAETQTQTCREPNASNFVRLVHSWINVHLFFVPTDTDQSKSSGFMIRWVTCFYFYIKVMLFFFFCSQLFWQDFSGLKMGGPGKNSALNSIMLILYLS